MRRPLKPFITEYKGSNRRANPMSTDALAAERQMSSDRLAPPVERERSSAKMGEMPVRYEPEDSYEAAMRAADALFSPRPGAEAPKPRSTAELDRIFLPIADAKLEDTSGTEPDARPAAPERGGRILQALDESPSPQMIALEEARAPKKRGRKPGSTNKPRAPRPALQDDYSGTSLPLFAAAVSARPDLPVTTVRRDKQPRPEPVRAAQRPLERAERMIEPKVPKPAGRLRFAWSDKTLKPGEFWKRRLPKVCW